MEVGIDVGGTDTRIVVADGSARVGDVCTPTTTWRHGTLFSDPDNALRLLDLVPTPVIGRADVPVVVGAHGCDTRAQCDLLEAWLRRRHPGALRVVNDSELFGPLCGLRNAINVVCGTGSIVVGRDAAGELVKVGGFGWILGDPGAAPSLVREAVIAILAQDDLREPPGILARLLMEHYGSADPVQLGYDFTADAGITRWGALAPLVFQAADGGDPLASRVIEAAGRQLAADVLHLQAKGVASEDVVVAGGVVTSQPRLERAFTAALAYLDSTLRVHVLRDAPVSGAVVLAQSLRPDPVRRGERADELQSITPNEGVGI
ncbi:MAG: hypothetical protein LBI33_08165 [Propionibacteriaceae bacterium]|jgi:N-acetylglucosamine kinase-like BadF-type ATPase|nr:hypothetical protein [Propionibacteriaceae bacterium]